MKEILDSALPLATRIVDLARDDAVGTLRESDGMTGDQIAVAITATMVAKERLVASARRNLSGEQLEGFDRWLAKVEAGVATAASLVGAAEYDPTKLGHGGDA